MLTTVATYFHKLSIKSVNIEIALNQLGDNRTISNKVHKGDIFDAVSNKNTGNTGREFVALVTNDLRHFEKGCLESGCPRTNEGSI